MEMFFKYFVKRHHIEYILLTVEEKVTKDITEHRKIKTWIKEEER